MWTDSYQVIPQLVKSRRSWNFLKPHIHIGDSCNSCKRKPVKELAQKRSRIQGWSRCALSAVIVCDNPCLMWWGNKLKNPTSILCSKHQTRCLAHECSLFPGTLNLLTHTILCLTPFANLLPVVHPELVMFLTFGVANHVQPVNWFPGGHLHSDNGLPGSILCGDFARASYMGRKLSVKMAMLMVYM